MIATGIASGLIAAVCQSVTYLLTRHYAEKRAAAGIAGAGKQLIVLGHIWMGLIALLIAPFCWPAAGVPWAGLILPLIGNTLGYAVGQVAQVVALRHAEASRVSPLMTSKLIVSSILVMLFGLQTGGTASGISLLQWIALPICIFAGISINFTGGKMKSQVITALAAAAVGFSISDYCITLMLKKTLLIPEFAQHPFQASLVAGLLSYFATAALCLPLLPAFGSRKSADWLEAVPFALVWFSSMVSLYNAFAIVGILLGSILQCTRGFITILFAAVVMRRGHHHIEPKAPRRVVLQRLAAGLLMFAGICLYVLKDRATVGKMVDQIRGVAIAPAATAASAPAGR